MTPHQPGVPQEAGTEVSSLVNPSSIRDCLIRLKTYLEGDAVIHKGTLQFAYLMASGTEKFVPDGIHNARVAARKLKEMLTDGIFSQPDLYDTIDNIAAYLEAKATTDEIARSTRRASHKIFKATSTAESSIESSA